MSEGWRRAGRIVGEVCVVASVPFLVNGGLGYEVVTRGTFWWPPSARSDLSIGLVMLLAGAFLWRGARIARPAATLALVLTSAGCGTMLDGKLYAIDQGIVMPLAIERSYGHGAIRASNPKTGEKLEGTYSGARSGSSGFIAGSAAGQPLGVGFSANDRQAPAVATLIGDRGSVLDCQMLIQAGLRPHGFGTCKDREGRAYRLQF